LQLDSLTQQLDDSEVHKNLVSQENKLRQIQKSVLYLSTYCASKTGESDYSQMQRNVLELVEHVNQHLQKQVQIPYSASAF
jgi:hypothetical protein